jgi:hypothetical protein
MVAASDASSWAARATFVVLEVLVNGRAVAASAPGLAEC